MLSTDLRDARLAGDRLSNRTGPVFVDRTGRRRRWVIAIGVAVATSLLASLIVLVAGLFTGGPLPLPGWPEPDPPGRAEIGAGRPVSTPSTTPAGQAPRPRALPTPAAGAPAAEPAPTAAPITAAATDKRGQGEDHRATPNGGRATRSPGKSR